MRKISALKSTLLSAFVLTASTAVWGEDFTIDNCKYTINADGSSVSVSQKDQNLTDPIVIPAIVSNGGKSYDVTAIDQKGFSNTRATSISIPASVTSIGSEGLAYGPNLESITFGEGIRIKKIENHTFKQDKKVATLEIPEGVQTIGEWVFEAMEGLTSFTLPSTLTSIGSGALAGLTSLETLTVKASNPPSVQGNTFNNWTDAMYANCKLVVPTGSKSAYMGNQYFGKFTNIEEQKFEIVVPSGPNFPAEGYTEGNLTYILNDDEKTVSVKAADANTAFEAIIPATITYDGKEYKVTMIADKGFQYSKITKVQFPNTVYAIGENAFDNAKSLTEIVIPNTIRLIGSYAFQYCEGLVSFTFEEDAAITEIKNHTFNGCKKITELEIPEGVTTIGDWCMQHMDAMTTLTLPSTITKLNDGALAWVGSMKTLTVKAINAPTISGTTNGTFRDFPFTTCKLIVPAGAESVYKIAPGFSEFSTIEGQNFGGQEPVVPTFPETGVTNGNGLVFTLNDDEVTVSVKVADKSLAFEANIPASITFNDQEYAVTAIAPYGFQQSNFTKITIPNSVTSIGNNAFENAKNFTEIVIPKSVSSIGTGAFQWCEKLETVTFEAGSALTAINDHTFKGCKLVKKLVIPEGVVTIGEWVFENMEAMVELTLPATLESIGSGALVRVPGIIALTVNAMTPPATKDNTFKDGSFIFNYSGCTLYIPEGTKNAYSTTEPWSNFINISSGDFIQFVDGDFTYAAKNETEVILTGAKADITAAVIPAKVTYQGKEYKVTEIGSSVFLGNQELASVTVPVGVKVIGANAFKDCSKLTEFTFPEGLESIGANAFEGSEVTDIQLPNSVTSLGNKCFPRSVKNLVLSKGLKALPNEMCMYNRLTTIVIPEGVETIGENAFYYSDRAVSISLPSTLTKLGHQAFGNTTALTSVVSAATVPPTVDSGQPANLFATQAYTKAVLVVPDGCKANYEQVIPWSNFATITEQEILTDEDFEVNGIRYHLTSHTTCSVIGLVNDMDATVVIPPAVKYNEAFVSVTAIAENGLADYNFTSVQIAQTVETIGSKAFNNVPLTSVKVYALDAPECAEDAFTTYVYENATLYVGAQCTDTFKAAAGWKNFKNIVEEVEVGNKFVDGKFSFTILEEECVAISMLPEYLSDQTITKLEIPAEVEFSGITYTVTVIADEAFKQLGCPGLLPEGFPAGQNHVKDCKGTIDVVLPNTIEEIGESAFMDAHIKSINLPSSLMTLGANCLRSTKLEGTLTIPVGVTELPEDALSWVWTLDRVELPNGLTSIGKNCFNYSKIKEVYLPATLESLASGAFNGTSDLVSIEVEDLESYLQIFSDGYFSSPFSGGNSNHKLICNGDVITEVNFGDYNMFTIGDGILKNYQGLKTVIFPDYFEEIGYEAFAGCTGIQEIYCYNTQPIECQYTVGTFASNVYDKATLYVPDGCSVLYTTANENWKKFKDIVEMEPAGVEEVGTELEGIAVVDGTIHNASALEVVVYDLTGRVLYSGTDTVINLDVNGLVIVKCGQNAIKATL